MKFVIGILAALLLAGSVIAGTIDPGLQEKIANSDPNTMYPTLIFMVNQLDVAAMKHKHDVSQATLATRHYEVITALQKIATESQADLLAYLEQGRQSGAVGEIRGFWITNMIYAELKSSVIQAVAARDEVDIVYADFKGEMEQPITDYGDRPPTIASVENGLRAVRADSMWAHGYTGDGRLVCNIDTGVDGNHPALRGRWHGANGYPASQSWLDTANPSNSFPHDEGRHGTHTMGTICGRSTTTSDTIGVAIDAQWIAARAVDVTGGNITMAFQWAADPDGDPNTVEDVPDVISNSWGSLPSPGNECPPDFYNVIDNCEAAGIVVVFAAGNEGPAASSLRIPANRITTPYNAFAVGAIDGNNSNYPIANFSSRGPSQCDGVTIKPEVVAPGVNVRSSVPGGSYEGGWSGTSMACPHVAGAVALLRQVNPNASVDTIKWALMQSARDLPFSNPNGEDNTYGYGIIDINAARALIPPINEPFVFPNAAYVVDSDDNHPDPGETIDLYVRLKNTGIAADNVAALVSSDDPYVNILQDSSYYGSIAEGDTARSATAFSMAFSSTTPPGHNVAFSLLIRADRGYEVTKMLSLSVGQLASPGIANHNIGNVAFTVSNFGQYGLASSGINPNWNGSGFKMPRTGANYLFEGALLIGIDSTRVSNGARDQDQNIDSDFQPITAIDTLQPGPFADQEHHSSFNDQGAEIPMNITVTQNSFSFAHAPDSNYVIVEYVITNSGLETLNNLLVAHYEDWDIPWGTPSDRANFDRSRNLGYQYAGSIYRGQQVLSSLGVYSFKAIDNTNEVYPPHFTLLDKWHYMNSGFSDTAITVNMDASIMITTGPYTLAPGDSAVAAFAILGGTSLSNLQVNADAAADKYATRVSIDDDDVSRPDNFSLSQNYPNPFNARTTIRFNVPFKAHVKLETFDILGRRVAILVDGDLAAGEHAVIWDCSAVPSGVYFYKLSNGEKALTKKMTLLK
jgi:subtilisin family serine protease